MARAVVVTGAGSGLGMAIAERLLARGFTVIGTARRAEDLARLGGIGVAALALDLADPASVEAALCELEPRTDLWAIVHNAGVAHVGAVEDLAAESWQEQFAVNLFGPIRLTRALLPTLRQQRGRVVFVSTLAARLTVPLMGAYCASKRAVEAAAEALRMEVHRDGVRVVVVQSGPVTTGFAARTKELMGRQVGGDPGRHASAYRELAAKLDDPPARVPAARAAATVARALTARRPRRIYRPGRVAAAGTRLVLALPAPVREAILRSRLGL